MTYNATGLPGGGPWKIVPSCTAQLAHNSLRAATAHKATGPYRSGAPRVKCTCPRALVLLQRYNEGQKERRLRLEREGKPGPNESRGIEVRKVNDWPVPHFTGREPCGGLLGREVFGLAIDMPGTESALRSARALCENGADGKSPCPILQQCRAWVLNAEIIPGSWGGVFGGLSKRERIAERIKTVEEAGAR